MNGAEADGWDGNMERAVMERTRFLPHFGSISGIGGGGIGGGGAGRASTAARAGIGQTNFMGLGSLLRRALQTSTDAPTAAPTGQGDDGTLLDDGFMPCGADDDYEYIQTDILYEDPCPARYTCVRLKNSEAEEKYNL